MTSFLSKFLPNFISKRIAGRPAVQKVLANSAWLLADKSIRIIVGLIVGVWVTRYLGPEKFGLLSYAVAFVAVFTSFAKMGLDNVIVKKLVENDQDASKILGITFYIKIFGSILAFLICMSSVVILRNEQSIVLLVLIISLGMFFQVSDIFDFWYQSQVQSKYTVVAKNSAFLFVSIMKVIFILNEADVEMFAYASLFEIVIGAILLFSIFKIKTKQPISLSVHKEDIQIFIGIIKESLPLMLSGFAIILYMRMDQIMIGQMLNDASVGLYSAAIRLSEIWYIIPTIVASSIYPRLIEIYNENENKYTKKLMSIMGTTFWYSIFLAVIIASFSDKIIDVLYGENYKDAAIVLKVHIFTIVLVGMSVIFSHRFILKKMQHISLYGTVLAVLSNFLLNLILIPVYGIHGAAISTLISYFIPMIFQTLLYDRSIGKIFLFSPAALFPKKV